ncbi:MAG: hypothetical protein KC657_25245 [Myxococcales bacterium]|nr:hypothetical protein [Myxococcales bacterium]
MDPKLVARRVSLAALALAALVPAAVACGDKKPANNASASFSLGGDDAGTNAQQCPPGQMCPPPPVNNCPPGQQCPPPGQCPPGQQCPPPQGSASAAPLGSVFTTDPNQLAQLLAAIAQGAQAQLGPMGVGDPVELGVKAAAAKYAPGMSPEGQMAKGNLAEGGHLAFVVNMDANHCYTVVAFGAGIADVGLNLLMPPYTVLSAQDNLTGPTAVIGPSPKPLCPIIPMAVPYKVDIYSRKGAGPVGAQVYSKPK